MQPAWRRSILLLTAIQVAGIAFVVGLVFVFLTAYVSKQYTQQHVSQRIESLLTTVEDATQIAGFTQNPTLAGEVANGLVKNGDVLRVVIFSGSEVLADRRKTANSLGEYPTAEADQITRSITSPLNHGEVVGKIVVDPDPEAIRARVRENGGFVAVLLGLQLLVVVGVVLAVVLLWVVRPIKTMSDKLHAMDAHSIKLLATPPGQKNTEIGRLVNDINQLGRKLVASRDEERQLRLQREIGERKYRAIFENADSGIFVVDQGLELESCNDAFYRQLGLLMDARGKAGVSLADLSWRKPEAVAALVNHCTTLNASVSDDLEYVVNDDVARWFNVSLAPIGDRLVQGLVTDISRHKQAEWFAQQVAITDPLTGLFNRIGFLERLVEEIVECTDVPDAGFSLFLIDLDGFKRINDSIGLASGDKILSITANRLKSCLKSSDVIARLGGDTFGIILRAAPTEKLAANVGARIVNVLKGFFEVGTTPLQLGASLGITLFPNDGSDQQTLLRNAELALDHARLGGGRRFSFFDVTMARNAEHRRLLENDLKFAVRRNELLIYFQPIIDLSARRLSGAEALVRWNHPERGMVAPDSFIPLAEETGSIVDIGLWMLEAACLQLAAWQAQGHDYSVSINISARQIPDGLPPISLIETINRYGVDPSRLAIEITESVFLGDFARAQTWLNAVHELGFRIYLDDFGTGYSSLSYLKRFPIDVLKVDKSFVRDMGEDNNDRALVEAIINMASSLGLTVVAEGVETLRQMNLLEKAGCRYVQGYYFSRPVPAEEFEAAEERIRAMLA
jgi:diguanylate cyclase (GGDEF)-like protein/PAS domain S-box-containing protein